MISKALFLIALSCPAVACFANGDYQEVDPVDGGVVEDSPAALYQMQTDIFQKLIEKTRTDPALAGYATSYVFRNETYTIDRTFEAKRATKTPPAAAPAISGLIGDLATRARGRIEIKVTLREFNKDGKLETESIWEMNMGGMWEAQSGMADAMDKSHK